MQLTASIWSSELNKKDIFKSLKNALRNCVNLFSKFIYEILLSVELHVSTLQELALLTNTNIRIRGFNKTVDNIPSEKQRKTAISEFQIKHNSWPVLLVLANIKV